MSGTRAPFYDNLPDGMYELVSENTQVLLVDEVVLGADAELDIQGELVILP